MGRRLHLLLHFSTPEVTNKLSKECPISRLRTVAELPQHLRPKTVGYWSRGQVRVLGLELVQDRVVHCHPS